LDGGAVVEVASSSTQTEVATPCGHVDPAAGIPVALTDGKRGVVRDLLAAYGGDTRRLEAVADASDHALLAAAAYLVPEDLANAARAGWNQAGPPRIGDRDLVGDVHTTLLKGPNGGYVLAFRGSVTAGDWVTNLAGTTLPTPLLKGQVADARRIAQEVAREHPGVVFAGHSLGGRLAEVASIETGRPAYVFNAAPVGINDVPRRGPSAFRPGPIYRFRSPEDAVSNVFSPSDTEVSNIVPIGANWIENLVGLKAWWKDLKAYRHRMQVLAGAMQAVEAARDRGWIGAYLSEQSLALGSLGPCSDDSAALDLDEFPACWYNRNPWRITLCHCRQDTLSLQLYGDGIYRQGSSPCTAATHAGLLPAGGSGILALEPDPGLSHYPGVTRNGVDSRSSRGGAGFTLRRIRSQSDIEAERVRSAAMSQGHAAWPKMAGPWRSSTGLYHFDGSALIAIDPVVGEPAAFPRIDRYKFRPYPAGTVVMRLTRKTEGGFEGQWLFRDRIWGPVEIRPGTGGEMLLLNAAAPADEINRALTQIRLRRVPLSVMAPDQSPE